MFMTSPAIFYYVTLIMLYTLPKTLVTLPFMRKKVLQIEMLMTCTSGCF